jgi:hypothetical protein
VLQDPGDSEGARETAVPPPFQATACFLSAKGAKTWPTGVPFGSRPSARFQGVASVGGAKAFVQSAPGGLRFQERPNECLVGCLAVAAPWKDLDREAGILVHRPRSEHRAQSSPDPDRDPDDPAYHWHGGDRVKGEVKSRR